MAAHEQVYLATNEEESSQRIVGSVVADNACDTPGSQVEWDNVVTIVTAGEEEGGTTIDYPGGLDLEWSPPDAGYRFTHFSEL